jgi:hypothetical protein
MLVQPLDQIKSDGSMSGTEVVWWATIKRVERCSSEIDGLIRRTQFGTHVMFAKLTFGLSQTEFNSLYQPATTCILSLLLLCLPSPSLVADTCVLVAIVCVLVLVVINKDMTVWSSSVHTEDKNLIMRPSSYSEQGTNFRMHLIH